jgi:4-pyridoxolactonase
VTGGPDLEGAWLLHGGYLTLDRSQVLWNFEPGHSQEIPVSTVLLRYGDAVILFDTGFDLDLVGREAPHERPRRSAAQGLEAQLDQLGLRLEDVDLLVHSHLHLDHVGDDRLLPAAEVMTDLGEYYHALEPPSFEVGAYADRSFRDAGRERTLVEGDHEIRPGLQMLATPGHSVGHASLLVERPAAPPLLCVADVVYNREGWEREILPGFHHDPSESLDSLARCKGIVASTGAEIVFAHEAANCAAGDATPRPLLDRGSAP